MSDQSSSQAPAGVNCNWVGHACGEDWFMTVAVAFRLADPAVLHASTTDLSAGRVFLACSADRWQLVCSVTC